MPDGFRNWRPRTGGLKPGAVGMLAIAAVGGQAGWVEAAEVEPLAAAGGGLVAIDWAIVAVYAAAMIGLGWYYARRQESTSEYFLGGAAMNPILIGVSLFATLLSTITYLSVPGETIGKGPLILAWILGFPFAYAVVAYALIPVYMRHRVTSAYELLEARLGLSVRLLGSLMFILLRLLWMSVLVFVAGKALVAMMGVPEDQQAQWLTIVVVVTGTVAIIYTSLGGIRAVVVSDFTQSVLLLGGALLVIATVTWQLGGLGWVPTTWQATWDVQPLVAWDPTVRASLLSTIIWSTFWSVCTAGGDQTSVQRFMATRDVAAARRAYAISLLTAAVVVTTLVIVGLALMGFYETYPELAPAGLHQAAGADLTFPHFIAYQLPAGISGVLVAAIFAAAMSSLDSGVNSITAVVSSDWLQRLGFRFASERQRVIAMRLLAVAIGVFVVAMSLVVGTIETNFLELIQRTANLLVPPIFGLFFFALFVPGAHASGAIVGALAGLVTAVCVAFSESLFGVSISFHWIAPSALTVNIAIGWLACWLLPSPARNAK